MPKNKANQHQLVLIKIAETAMLSILFYNCLLKMIPILESRQIISTSHHHRMHLKDNLAIIYQLFIQLILHTPFKDVKFNHQNFQFSKIILHLPDSLNMLLLLLTKEEFQMWMKLFNFLHKINNPFMKNPINCEHMKIIKMIW